MSVNNVQSLMKTWGQSIGNAIELNTSFGGIMISQHMAREDIVEEPLSLPNSKAA